MSKNYGKLVSICIPVWNGADMLHRAIESCIHQSYKNIEIIISDNASEDATSDVARHYQSLDKRVRYFRNERNIGGVGNFRKAIEAASGEFVQTLSHDDWLSHGYVEECMHCFDENPRIGAVVAKNVSLVLHDGEGDSLLTFSGEGLFRPGLYRTSSIFRQAYKTLWGNSGFSALMRKKDFLRSVGLEAYNNEFYRRIYTMRVPIVWDHLLFIKGIVGYENVAHTHRAAYMKTGHATNTARRSDLERGSLEETRAYYAVREEGYMSVYAYELKKYLLGLKMFYFTDFIVDIVKFFARGEYRNMELIAKSVKRQVERYSPKERAAIIATLPCMLLVRIVRYLWRVLSGDVRYMRKGGTLPPSVAEEYFLVSTDHTINNMLAYVYRQCTEHRQYTPSGTPRH